MGKTIFIIHTSSVSVEDINQLFKEMAWSEPLRLDISG